MVQSRTDALRLASELRERLAGLYGENLAAVYLFGSFARGEGTEDSDVDVAIVLRSRLRAPEERRRIGDVIGDLCLREGCLLNTFFLTPGELSGGREALHRRIAAEGVAA